MRRREGYTVRREGRDLKGFTLLESVIVISLLGLVTLSFGYLFSTAQRFMIQSINFTSTQTDASFALEHIRRHLTTATAITVPAAGASGATLEFTWRPTTAEAARTSRYELGGTGNTDLRFIPDTTVAGTFEVIARGIQTITFNRATAGSVAVDVTAQRSGGGDMRQTRLQTTINPRGLFQ